MARTACKLLRRLSQDTWERIQFSRARQGLKIYEVTITQNLIFELHKKGSNSGVKVFEAVDEKTNGNDLEFFVKTKGGYLFFPVQAKIIYSNLCYPRLEHGNQINDLRTYAQSYGGVPLYLLYNYSPNYTDRPRIQGINCYPIDFGCTFVSADFLFHNYAYQWVDVNGNDRWTIPSFDDLHPDYAIPWFIPFCVNRNEIDRQPIFEKLGLSFSEFSNSDIRVFSEDELEDQNWKPLDLLQLPDNDFFESRDDVFEKFSPKFRFILA